MILRILGLQSLTDFFPTGFFKTLLYDKLDTRSDRDSTRK